MNTNSKFKIRLLSACRRTDFQVGNFHFADFFSAQEADALLCEWAPNDELFTFPGPKAWYCCEATNRELFRTSPWKEIKVRLKPSEFLYHCHPDIRFRVPHITIEDDPAHPDNRARNSDTNIDFFAVHENVDRLDRAIAIISNVGGSPLRRSQDLALRNRFATHPLVDLYGSRAAWLNYQSHLFAKRGLPSNYKGELPGFWTNYARFDLTARYKVAICLENTCEPHYFTEKFVGAVQAGCIPIYRAHSTVCQSVLQGAMWVDPADFDYDVTATVRHALGEVQSKYCRNNSEWLTSSGVEQTRATNVFRRIGEILGGKFQGF